MREAIERNDTDAMKKTYDDLQNKFQEISADLYKQAAASAGSASGGGAEPAPETAERPGSTADAGSRGGNGDVVDAEFEVVDEDKKK